MINKKFLTNLKIFKILLDKSKVLWYNSSKVKGTPQIGKRGGQEAVKGLGLRNIVISYEYAGVAQLVER